MKISQSFCCLITQGLWLGLRTSHSTIVTGKSASQKCVANCWSPSLIGKQKLSSAASSNAQKWVYSSLFNVFSSRCSLGPNWEKRHSSAAALTGGTVNNSNQRQCWLLREGQNRSARKITSRCRVENQQTRRVWDRTRVTDIGGRRVLGPPRHPSGHLLCRKQGHKYNINQIPSVAIIK